MNFLNELLNRVYDFMWFYTNSVKENRAELIRGSVLDTYNHPSKDKTDS